MSDSQDQKETKTSGDLVNQSMEPIEAIALAVHKLGVAVEMSKAVSSERVNLVTDALQLVKPLTPQLEDNKDDE